MKRILVAGSTGYLGGFVCTELSSSPWCRLKRRTSRTIGRISVEPFSAIGCPELGKLGCDHDVAGYPLILDRVDAEFRRPRALAKGDDFCDFNFYRKGTAPPTEHLNK